MKKLISFLTIVIVLVSCTKKASDLQIADLQSSDEQSTVLGTEKPVNFSYSTPECERPQIVFRGETYGDLTTITSDSTVNLRTDQLYSVGFVLVAPRCTPGEIILGGDNSDEVNFWLGSFPATAEKQHVNLEDKYYVVVLGE